MSLFSSYLPIAAQLNNQRPYYNLEDATYKSAFPQTSSISFDLYNKSWAGVKGRAGEAGVDQNCPSHSKARDLQLQVLSGQLGWPHVHGSSQALLQKEPELRCCNSKSKFLCCLPAFT